MDSPRYSDRSAVRRVVAAAYRRLPPVRGSGRPLRRINSYFLENSTAPPIVTTHMRMGHDMIVDLRSRTEFRSYYTGDYDSKRIRMLCQFIPAGTDVLDVGANIGFWTVPLANRVGATGGTVHVFEPVAANVARLRENLRLNAVEDTVSVHTIALSDRNGTAKISLREDFREGASTGNAALTIDDGADTRFPSETVGLARLDDIAELKEGNNISFIKLDVEGHEDLVLSGGWTTLAQHRPIIFAEFNEDYFRRRAVDIDECAAEIRSRLSYRILGYDRGKGWHQLNSLKGRAAEENVLFVPEEQNDRIFSILKM